MNNKNGASQRNYKNGQKRLGSFENQSRAVGNEQDEVAYSDCERENFDREAIFRRRDIAGGILSQLIEDSIDQLAYIEKQKKRLKKRVESLEKLKKSLSVDSEEETK